MRNGLTFFISILLLGSLILAGCKEKVETPDGKEGAVKSETSVQKVPGPGVHKGDDIRKWIDAIAEKADPEDLKKAEKVAGKFTAQEIVSGIAVRSKPDFWDSVPDLKKLKTVSIMNTNFSKVRIEAGLADDPGVLSSTLYLEADEGEIIAASSRDKGAELFAR